MNFEIAELVVVNLPTLIIAITGFVALFIKQKDNNKVLEKKIEQTSEAINNSHPKHLRVELDDNHREILDKLDSMESQMKSMVKREAIMLERVGNDEDNASNEYRNIWNAISGLRNKK